jgi:hypothetical protein
MLRFYPREWRQRYEEEFVAMLEQRPASIADLIDIALGALDAHARPQIFLDGRMLMVIKLRRSVLAVLWAWVAFVVAGIGFQKMTEDGNFAEATHHGGVLMGLAFDAVVVGAVVTLVAVSAGGVPIAFAAIRHAVAEGRKDVPLLFAVPPLALAAFVGYTLLLTWMAYPAVEPLAARDPLNMVLFLSLIVVFLLATVASTVAVSAAVACVEVGRHLFRFALFPASLATLAMGVVLSAAVVWGVILRVQAPQLFWGNGGILATTTAYTWLVVVAVMAVSTVFAAVAVVRGFSARSVARTTDSS